MHRFGWHDVPVEHHFPAEVSVNDIHLASDIIRVIGTDHLNYMRNKSKKTRKRLTAKQSDMSD